MPYFELNGAVSFEGKQESMSTAPCDYPYFFQTCGYSAVDDIRAEIESQPEWDYCNDDEQMDETIRVAARRFGFFEPFTAEQEALAAILRRHKAGLLISTYAWGLYADYLAENAPALDEREYA